MIIDNVNITAKGFEPDHAELANYVRYVKVRVPNVTNILVTLDVDGFVNLEWTSHNPTFERIRRITGYLVGTIDRWNDAKQAEERDRVKHS